MSSGRIGFLEPQLNQATDRRKESTTYSLKEVNSRLYANLKEDLMKKETK
jgi:hypothetical protein